VVLRVRSCRASRKRMGGSGLLVICHFLVNQEPREHQNFEVYPGFPFTLDGFINRFRLYYCPVGPFTARITEPILRGSIRADFVCGICGSLLCCKGRAGLVVNATAIIPQADKAIRVFLAVNPCVLDRLLDIDFRLDWFVNCAHLTCCAVAQFGDFAVCLQQYRGSTVDPLLPRCLPC
jgi:hypothetical protein